MSTAIQVAPSPADLGGLSTVFSSACYFQSELHEAAEEIIHMRVGLTKWQINPLYVAQLVHLTRIGKGGVERLPFTKKTCELFDKFLATRKSADRWLRGGFWGTGLLTFTPFVAALPSVYSWSQEDPQNNFYLMIGLLGVSVVTNTLNFVATGIIPDRVVKVSSPLEARIQSVVADYLEIACTLIVIHSQSNELAKSIAKEIDVEGIKGLMLTRFSLEPDHVERCCAPLQIAIATVLKGEPPATAPQLIKNTFLQHLKEKGKEERYESKEGKGQPG